MKLRVFIQLMKVVGEHQQHMFEGPNTQIGTKGAYFHTTFLSSPCWKEFDWN